MSITHKTRRESYQTVLESVEGRHNIILEILGNRQMTAHEIAEALVERGYTPHYERNFAAPRLTELRRMGIVAVVGKTKSPLSGRSIALWAITKKEVEDGASND